MKSVQCVIPGGNAHKTPEPAELEAEKLNREEPVRCGRTLPDGSIEWYDTMEAFPAVGQREVYLMLKKYNWAELWPQVQNMLDEDVAIKDIAKEMEIDLPTLRAKIGQEKNKAARKTAAQKTKTPDWDAIWPQVEKILEETPHVDIGQLAKEFGVPYLDLYVRIQEYWKNQRQKNEEVCDVTKQIDWKAAIARGSELMDQGKTSYKAGMIVKEEFGITLTTQGVASRIKRAWDKRQVEPAEPEVEQPKQRIMDTIQAGTEALNAWASDIGLKEEAEEDEEIKSQPERAFPEHHQTAQEIATLLDKKRTDYGPENIKRFGSYGVLIRVSDKVERLINLAKRDKSPNFESLEDTWKDIAGYAILAVNELREGR